MSITISGIIFFLITN